MPTDGSAQEAHVVRVRGNTYEISNDVERQEVEPFQTLDLHVFSSILGRCGDFGIPLFDQLSQIVLDVWFELGDALGAESMRDRLALPCMLGPIARVEEASSNGNEGIIVLA